MGPGALLPTETHQVEATVEKLTAAISQHYKGACGAQPGRITLAELERGYFALDDETSKVVYCTLDTREWKDKAKICFDYADKVEIVNPLDFHTAVKVHSGGRISTVENIGDELSEQVEALKKPVLQVEWKGPLCGEKKTTATPQKRKGPADDTQGQASATFASRSSVQLSEALRKRLKPMRSNPNSPKRSSPASASKSTAK